MNYLVIYPEELVSKDRVRLEGCRLAEVRGAYDVSLGTTLHVVVVKHGTFNATVTNNSPTNLELFLSSFCAASPLLPITLLVGAVRPQMVKRVILLSASVGIERLIFVRTALGEKSYLSSRELEEPQITRQLELAAAQTGGANFTEVSCCGSLQKAIKLLPREEGGFRLLADTFGATEKLATVLMNPLTQRECFSVAIGSEKGWTDEERNEFLVASFQPFTLGSKIFRTEHAVALLLGGLLTRCGL